MPITLDVNTKLDNESARKTANEAQRYFSTAGDKAGDDFSRNVNRGLNKVDTSKARREALILGRAYDRAADQASNLAREEAKLEAVQSSGTATRVQLISQAGRAETAQRGHARAVREAVKAYRDLERAESGVGRRVDISGGPRASMVALAGGLTLAAGAAAATAGAMILLPGVIGSAAGAFGVLKLATAGFGDAIKDMGDPKKFAEDLQSLSPSAQQAALSIKSMMPALTDLKNATQESLFAGMGQQMNRLANQYLPTVRNATTGIAGAFNTMLVGASDQLMTPQTQAAMKEFLTNTTVGFQNLARAAAPFTKALTDIMAVGSEFFPSMGKGVADAAQKFSDFISKARESGQLKEWIGEGLEIIRELGSIVWEVGRAFMSLAPVARDVLPYIASAVHEIADIMHEHPGLIYGIVAAFAAWKTIQGVAALTTALTSISTLLSTTLPASAATGAAGIVAALAKVAIPAWLAYLVGKEKDKYDKGQTGIDPADPDYAKKMIDRVNGKMDPQPAIPGYNGGAGSFGTPANPAPPMPRSTLDRIHGTDDTMTQLPQAGLAPWSPQGVPGVPSDGAPYIDPSKYSVGANPVSGAQPYYPATGQSGQVDPGRVYDAESSVMREKNNLEQDRLRLLQLEAKGNADQLELMRAKNQIAEDERSYQSAQMKLIEAQQGSVKKMKDLASGMDEIGAALDKDLGISKGLPGLAENLTKFLANLAAAPLLGQLSAISQANPSKGGYGAMGILGAQGAFGQQFTGISPSSSYGPQGIGPAALGGGMGGYGSDAALLAGIPAGRYEQTQAADLTKGIGDCSSAVEDLVNIMDGRPTGGRSMATGNASEWLQSRGFLPGMGGQGDFRVGFNPSHMQATLPGGTNFNWGSDAAAAMRGMDGGAGAYDPAFTSHYYRPTSGSTVPAPLPSPAGQAPAYAALPQNTLTNPGLTNPAQLGGGTGGQTGPAQGWSPSVSRIGGVEPASGSGKGGFGITSGGTIDSAMGVAASGLDLLAPGAGQAAQTGMKLINRAIEYGGQATAIGAQGLMDTFLPTGGSELANKSWLTKIMGGIAGAAPALPNMAGKATAPQAQKSGDQGGNTTTNNQNITVNNSRATEDGTGRDIAAAQMAQNQMPGM